jgi:ketosteroid isomerase-like protein
VRVAVLALLFGLSGCRRPETAAIEAVRAYDAAVVAAYLQNDASHLDEVAGEAEVRRLTVLTDLKRSSRLTLVSELESLEVGGVEVQGDLATVLTVERWRYFDRPVDGGRPDGAVVRSQMELEYRVRHKAGRWRVEEATTRSSRPL